MEPNISCMGPVRKDQLRPQRPVTDGSANRPNNYIDTKPYMSSLLVLYRVYRLEIQSVMLVFSTPLVNQCPSTIFSSSPHPPSPLSCVNKCSVYVTEGGRGWGYVESIYSSDTLCISPNYEPSTKLLYHPNTPNKTQEGREPRTPASKSLYWSIFKKSRHLGFGIFIDIWSMGQLFTRRKDPSYQGDSSSSCSHGSKSSKVHYRTSCKHNVLRCAQQLHQYLTETIVLFLVSARKEGLKAASQGRVRITIQWSNRVDLRFCPWLPIVQILNRWR